jgi:hypothetical protein
MASTIPLLVRLPADLVGRFRRRVPVRLRSRFIQRLLEDALPPEEGAEDDPLYQAALAVERDATLALEMDEWESATLQDGLDTSAEGREGPVK